MNELSRSPLEKLGNRTSKKEFIISTLVLFILVLSGFYIRIFDLGGLSLSSPEPFHIYAAKSILETGEPTLPSGHPYARGLLFTQLVAFSFKFIGMNEFAARFPSAIFGTLSIILVFFIGKRFFGTVAGLISAFTLAFVPFEIVWSRECRMYTMYQFFFLFGFFAFYNGFENHRLREHKSSELLRNRSWFKTIFLSYWNLNWKWLFLSVVLLYISFSLHRVAGIFYFSVIFYLFLMSVVTLIIQGFPRTIQSKYFLSFSILTMGGVIGLLTPGVFRMIKGLLEFQPSWAGYSESSPTRYIEFLFSPQMFLLGTFFILGSIQILTRANKFGFYSLITITIPLFFNSVFASVREPRYIFDIFPLIVLVSSSGIYNFFKSELKSAYSSLYSKNSQFMVIGSFALFFLPVFLWFIQDFRLIMNPSVHSSMGGEYHPEWREACQYIKSHYEIGDKIIANNNPLIALYYCGAVDYGLDNGEFEISEAIKKNSFYIDPRFGAKAIINLSGLKIALSESPRGWLILDTSRFRNPAHTPEDVKRFIDDNLTNHTTKADGTISIFSWNKNHNSRVNSR